MYRLANITKDYPKGRGVVHALRGISLEIGDGEWLSIQGPTGHGKSTLLQLLGGLIAGGFGGWRAARLRPAAALSKVA